MVEKVTKKPKDTVTVDHPVGASLDVRSLPRCVTTVTISLNVNQIAQPSWQTDTLIMALRRLGIHEKAQGEVLLRARQILDAESESIKQCSHPVLRISYEPSYDELEIALYDEYKVEPIRSYRSETVSVSVDPIVADNLLEDGRSLSLPSTVDRVVTTSASNGKTSITTHTEQTVDGCIVSKDAEAFAALTDAFASAASVPSDDVKRFLIDEWQKQMATSSSHLDVSGKEVDGKFVLTVNNEVFDFGKPDKDNGKAKVAKAIFGQPSGVPTEAFDYEKIGVWQYGEDGWEDLTFDDGEPARTNGQVYQAIRNINRDCSNRFNSDKRLIENLGGGVYKINQEFP